MSLNILVYGGKGWIGSQFVEIVKNIPGHKIQYGESRVDDVLCVEKELLEKKPSHVISFIGRTHGKIDEKEYTTIDYLEQPGKLQDNIRDNLFSPVSLALICKRLSIHLTYLGTGCIFSYDENHPYGNEDKGFEESDIPNFFGSSYSTVKGFTDRIMHLLDYPILNLRIRMPIVGEDNPRNFITKITNYEKICSIPNSMTVLPELLPLVVDMMENNLSGTMNLTNPGVITHNEILSMYQELVDPTFTWKNFTIEEQDKILDSKRSNNCLDTSRLETMYNVRHIKDSVRNILFHYILKSNLHSTKTLHSTSDNDKNKNNIDHFQNTQDTILLVTGGYGFIGSNFINTVMEEYDKIKVINIDAMYYCSNEENVDVKWREDKSRYTFVKGNICSIDLVQHVLDTYKPTHIVHFAAQSHVQNSFSESIQYTHDNIVGTHTLLEACRIYDKLLRFIHVSTDEVYGESLLTHTETQKTETSILSPTNPYAATKAGAELIAQSYVHSFNMPIIITRGNNVYGPKQYPEKLIPRFISQLMNHEKVTIQGDGSCVRGFLHVQDTANAFVTILKKGSIGKIYNIGCDEDMEYSVMDIAKLLITKIKNTDNYANWITYIEDRPFNDKRYYICNNTLKNLGWNIQIKFEKGIDDMISKINN